MDVQVWHRVDTPSDKRAETHVAQEFCFIAKIHRVNGSTAYSGSAARAAVLGLHVAYNGKYGLVWI